jgi:hypothetical protein
MLLIPYTHTTIRVTSLRKVHDPSGRKTDTELKACCIKHKIFTMIPNKLQYSFNVYGF